MKINWRVRAKNPTFWLGVIGAVGAPVLAYTGMSAADLTTWDSVWSLAARVAANPYLLASVGLSVLSVLGVVSDPTTAGVADSERAMGYDEPCGRAGA